MSLFGKLEVLREQPIEKRKKILFVAMTISMTLVILFWIGIMTFNTEEPKTADNKGPSPWKVLSNTFKSTKDQIKESAPGEVYIRE